MDTDEVETAIKQILDKAVVIEDVIDIFDVAGINKLDVSISSEDFEDCLIVLLGYEFA